MYVLFPLMVGFGLYSAIFQGALTYDVFSFLMIELRVVVRFFELEALGAGHGGKCCIRISFRWNDPQVYINYRLKTVEHLSWTSLTYRFLNTIIDDLFSFVIRMPTAHRIRYAL